MMRKLIVLLAIALLALSPGASAQMAIPSGYTPVQGYQNDVVGSGPFTIIAGQGAGKRIYVTGLQCWNTSSTTVTVTLDDQTVGSVGVNSTFIVPQGGGTNPVFQTPLVVPANTALTFSPTSNAQIVGCDAQGYTGTP